MSQNVKVIISIFREQQRLRCVTYCSRHDIEMCVDKQIGYQMCSKDEDEIVHSYKCCCDAEKNDSFYQG